jgi:GntR family transcriptional regulator, transcriptional repressor for pyruvate dehydrogenase complex
MQFIPIKQNTVLDQLMSQLKDLFIKGTFRNGDRMPPEQEIASQLGIGRNSIREAFTILTFLGVIEKRGSKGTFVSSSENITEESRNWSALLHEREFASLMELRMVMEHQAIQILLLHKKDDMDLRKRTVEQLKGEIHTMETALKAGDDDMRIEADYRFHGIVINLCENVAFNTLYQTLHSFVIKDMGYYQRTTLRKKAVANRHLKLVHALEEGDLNKAIVAFREHLVNVRGYLAKPDPCLPLNSLSYSFGASDS